MSIKVYFVYEGEPDTGKQDIVSTRLQREAYKVKITIPEKWLSGPSQKLLSFFCETYNKKFPEKALVESDMYLKCCGTVVPLHEEVQKYVQEYNDLLIIHSLQTLANKHPEGSIACTNFGCGKRFVPGEGGKEDCHYHAKGPVFHDTYKYWGCCPQHKALDWDEFEAIPTCMVGPHSTENKPITFKDEVVENVALSADQLETMKREQQLHTVSDEPRRCGPREFEGATHESQQPPQEIKDGKATCRNFGCQQEFVVAENHDKACTHHSGGPVFWDTYKYWKCCPQKKCAEFDEFVKVPGCCNGPHKL